MSSTRRALRHWAWLAWAACLGLAVLPALSAMLGQAPTPSILADLCTVHADDSGDAAQAQGVDPGTLCPGNGHCALCVLTHGAGAPAPCVDTVVAWHGRPTPPAALPTPRVRRHPAHAAPPPRGPPAFA